jgi:hypothetical protein
MNIEELSHEFRDRGFLVLENFFEPELMDRADRAIRRFFGDDPRFRHEEEFLRKSQTEVIPWFPQDPGLPEHRADLAAPFDEMEKHASLGSLTAAILGEDWNRLYAMVMFSKKGSSGQAWHQDCAPEDSRRFNLNRLVYTRDLTADVGGQTVVIPGSHRSGLLPAGDPHEDLEGQLILSPRKGTLVLLHGHTWHRVLPVTGEFRFSANFRAAPAGTAADITDICVYRNMRYQFSTAHVVEERVPAV